MTPSEAKGFQIKSVAALIAVLLAGSILVPIGASSAAAPSGAEAPNYVPRAKGPLKVAGTPVGLGVSYRTGGRFSDLDVVNQSAGGFQHFSNTPYGRLELAGSTSLPGTSGSNDGISTFFPDYDAPYHAFAHPDTGSVSLLHGAKDGGADSVIADVPAGTSPSSATVLSPFFTQYFSKTMPAIAVTDSADDTFSLIYAANPAAFTWSVEVGDKPVAAAAQGDALWFVANQGSDDVTLVGLHVGDGFPEPVLEVIQTVPVGDAPVDVVYLDPRGPVQTMAVVNRDSDSVSILDITQDGNAFKAEVSQEIGVGDRPTSIAVARVNEDNKPDLVVTNSGSDDLSLLINQDDTHFSQGQRIKVGERPVDVVAMRLDRYFNDDLAVANAGDRNVSLLLKRDGTATCRSRPAHLREGTDGDDVLRGTRDPDRIRGGEGADMIRSNAAYDCINGGPGADDIFSGHGNDRILGGPGGDHLSGLDGNDLIRAGKGNDVICDSDKRFDHCYDSGYARYIPFLPDRDRIYGGRGNDRIQVGPGRDRVDAGPGNDRIDAMDGERDRIDCGRGVDRVKADIRDGTVNCEKVMRREPGFRH